MAASPEENIINHIREIVGEDLIEAYKQRERRVFVRIKPEAFRETVQSLKEHYKMLRFITISAVDSGLDMEYLYHFHVNSVVLTLKVAKPKENNTLESISDIIPAANLIEREISDLFGVKLLNHPQPEHGLVLTKDWPDDKRPLRKTFEGILPPQARPVAEALISSGCVAPISSFIQRKREEAGLPKSPAFAFMDEGAMREFHGIIKDVGLAEKTGFDWEKRRLRYK
jgi:Ni,Fe-hydrogenase III component G